MSSPGGAKFLRARLGRHITFTGGTQTSVNQLARTQEHQQADAPSLTRTENAVGEEQVEQPFNGCNADELALRNDPQILPLQFMPNSVSL